MRENSEIISILMDEILQDEVNYVALEKLLYDFRMFLLDITGLDLNDFEDRKDLEFENGIALCTTFAALCTHDIMRTRQFIRGIYQAIRDVQKKTSKPVHVFYAGTGPFATLLLPILTKLNASEIRLHLMDVNTKTLAYLDKVIEELDIETYVEQVICADATKYTFDPKLKIDILVSETMQHGLVKEQQVPIMINLVSQLPEDTIIIPNNIRLELALRNGNTNLLFEGKYNQIYKKLNVLWDFTPEFIRSNKQENTFELCKDIDFSDDENLFHQLVVLTSIQIYKDIWLLPDASGLTIPRTVLKLEEEKNKKHISLSYVIQQEPDFEVVLG